MDSLLSPRQVADAIGASESSLKRWCDQGLLTVVKTAGGHRRIPVPEVLRFVREQNHAVVEPLILAMPATADRKARRIEGCAARLTEALLAGNEPACQALVGDLFLAGQPVSLICDEVLARALHSIGEQWECHTAEVWQERCSCQIALRILHDLRARQTPPRPDLLALGATAEGDQYALPVTMAELVLRSVGWNARLLGSSIPLDSLTAAIRQHRPGLFWLSASHIPDEPAFVAGFQRLFEAASKTGTAIVVGGRALTPEVRTQLQYAAFGDTMRHLEEFARTLRRSVKPASRRPSRAGQRPV